MPVERASGANNSNLVGQIASKQNQAKTEGVKKAASSTSNQAHTLGDGDKVEISTAAKEMQNTLSALKAEISGMSDTRDEKIQEVKANIRDGIYERSAVTNEVAKSLMASGLI